MRKQKGITLIALIITIVVMLILVAVSVKVIVNSDLIGHAEKTGDKYKTASKEENGGTIVINGKKYASIDDYINNKPVPTIKVKMEVTHEEKTVTADGTNIKSIEQGVPIPVGYYYVGGTKDTGVVISDDSSDEGRGDDHSISATLAGNQFVWVPVLQNQKLKIEVTAEEEITSIELLDPTGTAITTPAPTGKSYGETVNPTRNGEYKLTVKTAKETNESLFYVSTLYAQDLFETRKDVEERIKAQAEESGRTELEELKQWTSIENPTIEKLYFEENKRYYDNKNTEEATVTFYQNSVNKYGGFYIARYGAGSENELTDSNITTEAVLSKANKYPWTGTSAVASREKAQIFNNGKTNVTADLINGAGWDRTLNWIVETNSNMSLSDINKDSTSWGNYANSQFYFTGKYLIDYKSGFTEATTSTQKPQGDGYLLGTGVSEYTKKNNIYDLAGNLPEWTTEANKIFYYTCRSRPLRVRWL